MWKFHRSMTRPFFSRDRISDFDTFERHADKALSILKSRFAQGVAVDIQDLAGRFTLDSATEFLFGKDIRSLDGQIPYPYNVTLPESSTKDSGTGAVDHERFIKAFNAAQIKSASRMRWGTHWPLTAFWKDPVNDHMQVVKAVLNPILADALRKKTESEVGMTKEEKEKAREERVAETLLDHLLDYTRGQYFLMLSTSPDTEGYNRPCHSCR
jgi:hypothetical protein